MLCWRARRACTLDSRLTAFGSNMKNKLATLCNLALLGLIALHAAPAWSNCTDPSNPQRFTYGRKGDIVCDRNIKVIWMRCSYGQIWSSSTKKCEGDPYRTTGAELLELLSTANSKGWQLPTQGQISAILDSVRDLPKIDSTAFPETPPGSFWTAEALAQWQLAKPFAPSMIDFSAGAAKESTMPSGTGFYVRLLLIPGSSIAIRAGITAQ
jgi:Protein of unknown function (DUF1566)